MKFEEFIQHYSLNAPQLMWFLGAGASRSAGMPSAIDIIWDLKRRYYCAKENRDITDNDLSNEAIKSKLQHYHENLGCPPQWSEEEYAYYFKLVFGDKPELHQRYLEEKLDPTKISINSGHRILAALMEMNLTKLIFTTNFDTVVERAYSFISNHDLRAFDLNGSYAALNALNNESFPIYAKMHGDFRFFEMKNLPEQLVSNDEKISKCFINASSRYGLIVTGYSGRDKNVMQAFNEAIEQNNAFPKGLFWMTSVQGKVFPAVTELINNAVAKGINAHIVEADTFDSLMISIWNSIQNKHPELDKKVRRATFEKPNIPKYSGNGGYPIIRTNAFPIIQMPNSCRSLELFTPISKKELVEKIHSANSSAILLHDKTILAWGNEVEISKVISPEEIKSVEQITLIDYLNNFRHHTSFNSFCTRAIARALVNDKPLRIRKKHEKFYAVVSTKHPEFSQVEGLLKNALREYDFKTRQFIPAKSLAGRVPNTADAFWMECVEISVEYYDGSFWLILLPDIWIEPDEKRKEAKDFLVAKKRKRYNSTQSDLLNAWKQVLFGKGSDVILKTFAEENNPSFTISTTTAYSQKIHR